MVIIIPYLLDGFIVYKFAFPDCEMQSSTEGMKELYKKGLYMILYKLSYLSGQLTVVNSVGDLRDIYIDISQVNFTDALTNTLRPNSNSYDQIRVCKRKSPTLFTTVSSPLRYNLD